MPKRRRVARLDELPEGVGWLAPLGEGEPDVALFRRGSKVSALHAICPHRGAVLAFGEVRDGLVFCPLHAWAFRLDDGSCPEFPGVCVVTYPVAVEGGEVFVEL
ncbi:MAG TPA: Rieske (2Fe-2S) protein [Anaeromyxobacter sp.]|nr:Rieske (2Fe-2S) protein [Anaeromyxobacter sp.]